MVYGRQLSSSRLDSFSSWDTRAGPDPAHKHQAHEKEILSVAYHPAREWLVITGSADKVRWNFTICPIQCLNRDIQTIGLHDLRKPATKVHTFESHTDEVLSLAWSPHNATVFGSASSDRRINVWDLNQIGVEQTPDDQEDGPPELLFVHGGRGILFGIKRMLIGGPRSHCATNGLLLGARRRRSLDGCKRVGGQHCHDLATDYADLGWRRRQDRRKGTGE